MPDTITLDRRKFQGISQSLSANQDDYIIAHLRVAGVIEVMDDLDGKKRTPEERAEDLLTRILLSGEQHHVLAGCLTEEGKLWNRAEADRNAALFAAITDGDQKRAMRSAIIKFVIAFFMSGEPSSETSRKSSSSSAEAPPTRKEARSSSATSRKSSAK